LARSRCACRRPRIFHGAHEHPDSKRQPSRARPTQANARNAHATPVSHGEDFLIGAGAALAGCAQAPRQATQASALTTPIHPALTPPRRSSSCSHGATLRRSSLFIADA
jgi:hypothetical protein